MNAVFNIALLLLSTFVVKSLENQELKLKEKGANQHAEETLQDGLKDVCSSCKLLIIKMQEKMGKETSKDKIAKQLGEFCSKDKMVKAACKKMDEEAKKQICEAFSKGGDAESVCKKAKLCEKTHSHHL